MKKVSLKPGGFKKIDSPLAKYNSSGQLYCVLCNTPVKNEMFWTGHVSGRGHRDQLLALKNKGKRPAEESSNNNVVGKKAKVPSEISKEESLDRLAMPPPKAVPIKTSISNSEPETSSPGLRSQEHVEREEDDVMELTEDGDKSAQAEVVDRGNLPAGFFDDPKLDAKARGVEYKNPEEAEWALFMKEMATEEIKSTALRSQDEDKSTRERELDEIEEQMAHWQKVIELEKKAQVTKQRVDKVKAKQAKMEESDSEDNDYDENLDWRSKKH